ncbi:MAG: domain S-box [Myxococcaceae bacterium]|nr:domain S-box [Myxococcaceae bacterium]
MANSPFLKSTPERGEDPDGSLLELRSRVLNGSLTCLSWASFPIGALLVAQGIRGGFSSWAVLGFAAFSLLVLPLRMARHKLGYSATALLFVGYLFVLASYSMGFRGLTAGAALLQVMCVLTATMLFGRQGALWALLACTVALAASAVLMVGGFVTPWSQHYWDPALPIVWVRYMLVFLALGGSLAFAFANLVGQLHAQLLRLQETLAAERAERVRREAVQTELARTQRFEALALLAGGTAHDLNNGLSVIMSAAELISIDPDASVRIKQLAADVVEAATGGADTVRQLLTLARRDDAKPCRIEVKDALLRLSGPLARVLTPLVKLRVGAVPQCAIFVDMSRFQRVMLNLSVNARDAMPLGGELSIDVVLASEPHGGARSAGEYVRIDCTDTGTGMDEETLHRVFEPFFTTKPAGKGTGLGLAMVQTVLHDAGGYVVVESTPGRGTTVRLFFPKLSPHAEQGVQSGSDGSMPEHAA